MNTRRTPGLVTVAYAQLELLVRMKYPAAIAALLLIGLTLMHRLVPAMDVAPPWLAQPTLSNMYVQLVFVGGVAAALVWVYDAPRNRRYHWSMPVRRETHDFLRVAAGAFWLVVAIAAFCVVAWFAEDRVIREQWLSNAPLYWLGLFLVPLLAYLLCTVAALVAGRPVLWLAGGSLLVLMLATETVEKRAPLLHDVVDALLLSGESPPSLGVALSGGYQIAPWNSGRDRYRVYAASGKDYFAEHRTIPLTQSRLAVPVSAYYDRGPLEPSRWLQSLLIWYVIAFCGIALAVRRRPDV